jgi:sortase (surface protein transpeptidase)
VATSQVRSRIAAQSPGAGQVPQRITIPVLGVNAPIDQVVTTATGSLGVPQDPTRTGWWSGGARPGSATGTAVLDGHVNYGGTPGAFAGLSRLRPGDVVTVSSAAEAGKYVVTGLREYPKASLPWSSIFSSDVPARLVLITCGGSFDPATGHYADNVVVFAVPAVLSS